MRALWAAWMVTAVAAAAAACGDEPRSSPEPNTCRGSDCAGRSAGEGGGGAGGAPAAAGVAGSAAGRGGAGSGAAGEAGSPAGAGAAGAGAGGMVAAGGAAASGGAPSAGSGGGVQAGSGPNAGAMSEAGSGAADCVACERYAMPAELARVQVDDLNALSGLAVGRTNPEVIFAHNDRSRPVVYALDMQGELRARLSLDAPATDLEDIAVGPCPEGTCIYLADIGDNAAQRAEYALLRFVEPELSSASSVSMTMPSFERIRFTYEDGSHNAEGFMIDAASGKLYVVTKVADGQPSSVYRIDEAQAGGAAAMRRAVKVADLPVPKASDMAVSAAAAHPCGRGFVLRTYNTMYEFRIPAGAVFESAFRAMPVALNAASEPQSEAIGYFSDGSAIVSSGESGSAPIFVARCEP